MFVILYLMLAINNFQPKFDLLELELCLVLRCFPAQKGNLIRDFLRKNWINDEKIVSQSDYFFSLKKNKSMENFISNIKSH